MCHQSLVGPKPQIQSEQIVLVINQPNGLKPNQSIPRLLPLMSLIPTLTKSLATTCKTVWFVVPLEPWLDQAYIGRLT